MRLKESNFLKEAKKPLKEMINNLSKDFKYVSVLVTDCCGKSYDVSKKSCHVGAHWCNERGAVVRVHNGIGYSEYSFGDVTPQVIKKVEEIIKRDFINIANNFSNGVSVREYEVKVEEEVFKSFNKEVEIDPTTLKDDEIIDSLTQLKDEGLKLSEELIDFIAGYQYLQVNKMFLSAKKDLEQSYMWSEGFTDAVAERNDDTKYYSMSKAGLNGAETINMLRENIKKVVDTTIELLSSEPVVPGEYEVVCAPGVSGLIAHEAFGHGVEMDMFLKDRAKSKDYIGNYVASELVTMYDGASGVEQASSYAFDDEGVLAQNTKIIDKGILVKGMSDSLTAAALNTMPTSNGKRASFERKAYTRMTNTYFGGGNDKVEDMISSIKDGFLLEGDRSGMEDPKNWGIQCILALAREIKDGKLTGKVFSPIILTGYVPDLLKSISMVSEDVEIEGSGFCGKGYKEWVKAACGGPYIKAKVRLG